MRTALLAFAVLAVPGGLPADEAGPAPPVPAGWFEFAPRNTSDGGAVGMAGWLDTPAGRHGVLTMEGEQLKFADGTAVKFWGLNNAAAGVMPEHAEAGARAAWYAKYGVNAIRFHKFTSPVEGLGDKEDSTKLDPVLLERMDYYAAALKRHGIYHTWSHIWGHVVRPADRARVLAYDEIVAGPADRMFAHSTYGIANLFEDLQDLHIDLTVAMLTHVNPHTGLRYADEPALAMIELQNEDNVWWVAGQRLRRMPTYRARLAEMFSDWLREKYGSEGALLAAWGPQGLDLWPEQQTGESLSRRNIYPVPDRRYYQPGKFAESQAPRRLLDCVLFLHERQERYYQRFAEAIRATGYKGLLIGSCWIAEAGLPHYFNLLADYNVGLIDRHTYYGGSGYLLETGKPFGPSGSMLRKENLGLLGVGMLQVKDRPFIVSEWNGKPPNEWVVEGPPVVAFYGMGLQGWDGSFQYASGGAGFWPTIDGPRNIRVFNTNSPTQMGLYPALARAVYRGDVREGAPALPRRQVGIENLQEGVTGLQERTAYEGESSEVAGAVPAATLTRAKVQLEFLARADALTVDRSGAASDENGASVSNTGELTYERQDGVFTVNTRGTKAVVGAGGGCSWQLDDMAIAFETRFAAIVMTDAERTGDLTTTRRALLMSMARARNSGQRYNADGTILEDAGQAPVLIEGVDFTLTWPRLAGATVRVLDHDGLRTDRTIPVSADGTLILRGAKEAAFAYEIGWE